MKRLPTISPPETRHRRIAKKKIVLKVSFRGECVAA
jgi:hypothetical protein